VIADLSLDQVVDLLQMSFNIVKLGSDVHLYYLVFGESILSDGYEIVFQFQQNCSHCERLRTYDPKWCLNIYLTLFKENNEEKTMR
jgi:hypothetical protein